MTSDPHPRDENAPEQPAGAPEADSELEGSGERPAEVEPNAAEVHDQQADVTPDQPRGDQPRGQAAAADTAAGGRAAGQPVEVQGTGKEKAADAEEAEAAGAGAKEAGEGEGEGEEDGVEEVAVKEWYIVKVQVNREDSIRRALERRIKLAGLEQYFGDIVVATEDVAEFNKSGKRRVVKKKLYPGYIMVNLVLNDETWFLVRETPGIGDFTGSAGKPTPMEPHEVQRIITTTHADESGESPVRTSIPFKPGDRVRVKEGYFENFEGDVEAIDDANGRVTVMINIFGRSTPVELEHWQVESV